MYNLLKRYLRLLKPRYIPLFLFLVAILELREDIIIILDQFTITSVLFAIRHNFLAVLIIIFIPSIWNSYSSKSQ